MALPKPSDHSGTPMRSLPEPQGGDFDPFLKAEDVGKLGTKGKITIIGPPEESSGEFSDLNLPVKYRGENYMLGLKFSGGSYARLFKRFGSNPKKWKGTVAIEVKHFKKNDYVAVV